MTQNPVLHAVPQVSAQFAPPEEEPEAVTAMKEHLRTRMKDQEEHEVSSKKQGEDDARKFLDVRPRCNEPLHVTLPPGRMSRTIANGRTLMQLTCLH